MHNLSYPFDLFRRPVMHFQSAQAMSLCQINFDFIFFFWTFPVDWLYLDLALTYVT